MATGERTKRKPSKPVGKPPGKSTGSGSHGGKPLKASKSGKPEKAAVAAEANPVTGGVDEDGPGEESILERTALSLAGHPLPAASAAAKTLAAFAQVRRLDMSHMQPSDDEPDGLKTLAFLGKAASLSRKKHKKGEQASPLAQRLTWLNVAGNESLGEADDAWDSLAQLVALNVLNASHCAMRQFPAGISVMHSLKALVLSHNALESLPSAFPHLPELNTLVLSHNALRKLPSTLPASLPALKKLSLSHNRLGEEGDALPDLTVCMHLREVRLNGNEALRRLPESVATWGRGVDGRAPGLVLLDLGDCGLDSWESVAPLLRAPEGRRKGLANLSLRGNGVTMSDGYKERVCGVHPTLRVLDNVRVAEDAGAEGVDAPDDQAKPAKRKAGAERAEAPKRARPAEPVASDADAATSEAEAAAVPEAGADGTEAPEKRPRKRSGRGPKKHGKGDPGERQKAQAGPPEGGADARQRSRAGPPPGESEPEASPGPMSGDERRRARAGPPPDGGVERRRARAGPPPDDERLRARAGPPPDDERLRARAGPPPDEAPSVPRSGKRTRRSKKGATQTLEMDMDEEPSVETPPAPAPAEAPPAEPSQPTPQDTGVVRVVDVQGKRGRAPPPGLSSLLAKRPEEDLGGW